MKDFSFKLNKSNGYFWLLNSLLPIVGLPPNANWIYSSAELPGSEIRDYLLKFGVQAIVQVYQENDQSLPCCLTEKKNTVQGFFPILELAHCDIQYRVVVNYPALEPSYLCQNLDCTFSGCVTLDRLFNLYGPRFPAWNNDISMLAT